VRLAAGLVNRARGEQRVKGWLVDKGEELVLNVHRERSRFAFQ